MQCESCMYYQYDEEYEEYFCDVNLDEDEMERFLRDGFRNCPYYRLEDEYRTDVIQKNPKIGVIFYTNSPCLRTGKTVYLKLRKNAVFCPKNGNKRGEKSCGET